MPRPSLPYLLAALCGFLTFSTGARGSDAPLGARMDSVLSKSYPADGPGAAVIVVQRGQTLLRKGYGLADLARRVRMAPDDVFNVGSITKQFTAVAILQLAAGGKLRLDDDITRYVPDFPTHGRTITLSELLEHTSGIPNYATDAGFRANPGRDLSVAQILGFVRNKPLDFAPGSQWAYSNTGYVLLGAVIEKVSGQTYGDYLKDHVFAAAGLTHTFYDDSRTAVGDRIPGYSRTPDRQWVGAEHVNPTQAFSAGGLRSNVDDLWRWEQALAEGRLLSPDLVALARSPARFDGGRREAGYGLGWELGFIDGHPSAGHGGTISGFRTYEVSVPSLGLFIAILCNADRPRVDPEQAAEEVTRLAAGEARYAVSAAQLKNYAGLYRSGLDAGITITAENGQLFLEPAGMVRRSLCAVSAGCFIDPESADWYGFGQDANGRSSGLEIRPRSGVARDLPRQDEPAGPPQDFSESTPVHRAAAAGIEPAS